MTDRLVGEGRTAQVFEYGEGKVLKLYRPGFSADACDQEYRVVLKVQKVVGNCPKAYERLEVEGRPGIIYEKVKGETMMALLAKKPWRVRHYAHVMAREHARIHQRMDGGMRSIHDQLNRQIERGPGLEEGERAATGAMLERLPHGDRLCHMDIHPLNLMMGERVVIIDWVNACRGSPAADASRTWMILRYSRANFPSRFLNLLCRVLGRSMAGWYLKEYRRITGISQGEIDRWALPIMAARLNEHLPEGEVGPLLKAIRKRLKGVTA